jgi:hypothetical protein
MISLSLLAFARWGISKNCRRLLEYRVLENQRHIQGSETSLTGSELFARILLGEGTRNLLGKQQVGL